MKNLYQVKYNGSWLGGIALVIASSEQEAKDLVSAHPRTVDFENVTVTEIPTVGVVYNDNGEY